MKEYHDNHEEIAVLDTKLDQINKTLETIVRHTSHIEQRVDSLEQGRFAVKCILGILTVMLPFVMAIGAYTMNLHIQHAVEIEVNRILEEGGYK